MAERTITEDFSDLAYFTSTAGKAREPKQENRFLLRLDRVPTIPALSYYNADDNEFKTLLLSLNNFSRPEYSVSPVEIPNFNDTVYHGKLKYPYKKTYYCQEEPDVESDTDSTINDYYDNLDLQDDRLQDDRWSAW